MKLTTRACCVLALILGVVPGAVAVEAVHPGERAFAHAVAQRHHLSEQHIIALLNGATKQQSILDAIARPAESKSWAQYRPIFMTPLRVSAGAAFYQQHRGLLRAAQKRYGVPGRYIVAILGVETNYGLQTGSYSVLDALVTLAFYYPPRAAFFRSELAQLLTLPASRLPAPLTKLTGSYAGAMGWGQFMPSSIAAYAVDGDGDGRVDLGGSLPDIVDSVARYLAAHGWQRGQPVAVRARRASDAKTLDVHRSVPEYTVGQLEASGYTPVRALPKKTPATLLTVDGKENWITLHNFEVITHYNRSPMYALVVKQLAAAIAEEAAGQTATTQ